MNRTCHWQSFWLSQILHIRCRKLQLWIGTLMHCFTLLLLNDPTQWAHDWHIAVNIVVSSGLIVSWVVLDIDWYQVCCNNRDGGFQLKYNIKWMLLYINAIFIHDIIFLSPSHIKLMRNIWHWISVDHLCDVYYRGQSGFHNYIARRQNIIQVFATDINAKLC